MNWRYLNWRGIVCSCSTERGIRERENEMSGIVIEKVRKSFDTKDGVVEALKDVNLNIDSGDIYGIIGMSGAGKSTLVRCMNFLEVPTEGRVLLDGKDIQEFNRSEYYTLFSAVFQDFSLLAGENKSSSGKRLSGKSRPSRKNRSSAEYLRNLPEPAGV